MSGYGRGTSEPVRHFVALCAYPESKRGQYDDEIDVLACHKRDARERVTARLPERMTIRAVFEIRDGVMVGQPAAHARAIEVMFR